MKRKKKKRDISRIRRKIDNYIYGKYFDTLSKYQDQDDIRFPMPSWAIMSYQTEEYMRYMNGEIYSSKL